MAGARFLPSKRPLGRGRLAAPPFVAPVLLFVLFSAGCGTSCFVFISNPPNGVIVVGAGTSGSGCLAPTPHGTVHATAHLVPTCDACAAGNRTHRVFLTLKGIELRSTPATAQTSGDWQELNPDLEQHPVEIEMESALLDQGSKIELLGPIAVPVGSYDLIRLRLASGPSEMDSLSGSNPWGPAARNYVQMADGQVHPLSFDSRASELLVPLAGLPGGSLVIAPNSENELSLELTPRWSAVQFERGDLRFLPSLMSQAKLEYTPTTLN